MIHSNTLTYCALHLAKGEMTNRTRKLAVYYAVGLLRGVEAESYVIGGPVAVGVAKDGVE
jgi:hypothetical protein